MARLRHQLPAAVLLSGLASAACGTNEIEPKSISFPHSFVGLTSRVALQFTRNGQPIESPEIKLVQGAPEFAIRAAGALGVEPGLTVTPTRTGSMTAELSVRVDGIEQLVSVVADPVESPGCAGGGECQPSVLDPDSGECVATVLGDGTTCGNDDCVNEWQCHSGQCVPFRLGNAVDTCVPNGATPQTVQPTWSFITSFFPVPEIYGVFDTAGNQYLEECESDGQECNLIAITVDGNEAWRHTVQRDLSPSSSCTTDSLSAMVAGGMLIAPRASPSMCLLEGRSLVDGSVVWNYAVPVDSSGLSALSDQGFITLVSFENAYPQLFLIDLATGQPADSSVTPASSTGDLGAALVGDGQGNLWSHVGGASGGENEIMFYDVSTATPTLFEVPGASSFELGSQWSSVVPTVCAASGSTLVTTVEAISSGAVVGGYPAAGEAQTCEVVSSNSSAWFSFATSLATNCPGTLLDRYDANSGLASRCLASTGIPLLGKDVAQGNGAEFLTATDGGGAAYLLWQGGTPNFVAVDSNAHLVAEFALAGFPPAGQSNVARTALIGNRLIVNMTGSTTTILAFDLPGIQSALHGWLSQAGGPSRQNAPE